MKKQSGFTMIELIMVIVILGILAAVAIPRFADLGAEARISKMKAAKGALQAGYTMVHGTWLAKGSPVAGTGNSTSANSVLLMEGIPIAFVFNGYPDVGGDGSANVAVSVANSGILKAAGGLADYSVTADANVLTIAADTDHAGCVITYTEPTTATPGVDAVPSIVDSGLTVANCD